MLYVYYVIARGDVYIIVHAHCNLLSLVIDLLSSDWLRTSCYCAFGLPHLYSRDMFVWRKITFLWSDSKGSGRMGL